MSLPKTSSAAPDPRPSGLETGTPYTSLLLGVVNSPTFRNFKSTLSTTGTATASITIPANLPGIPSGFKLYHAYVVYDGTTGQIFTSSNLVSVEFK